MWLQYETLYIYITDSIVSQVNSFKDLACFDLDWTLVRPQSSKFPRNSQDNVIMENRVKKLKDLISTGYTIVIYTNQKVNKREPLQSKINRIKDVAAKFEKEGIPFVLLMATEEDKYRKPNKGMWDYTLLLMPLIKSGFYCGDAAGRPKDFSDSDLNFAKNIGLSFHLPEDMFK